MDIPLGVFTCVTGVSGSGKSSLVNEVLKKTLLRDLNRARTRPGEHDEILGIDKLDKIIDIDQSPIGRTPRSNPRGVLSVSARGFGFVQTAEGEFAGKAHPSEKGNKAEINQQERRAAVLAHAVREHPDVAHAHGGADRGKDEADAVFEIGRLVLLHEKAFLSAAAELRPAAV